MMSIKLVIFDLDGTLVDSSKDITNALNYAIEPYGLKHLTVEDAIKMVGEGITRLIEKLLGEENKGIMPDVLSRFLDYYSEHLLDNTRPYPCVRETLTGLGSYKKAVISNKRENLSRKILEGLGLIGFFDIVMGSDSVPEKKPSPLPVKKVIETLGVGPHEAVIVGDSNLDIEAGKAAGVLTVAVKYGYRPIEVISHADHIIDKITELIPLLARLNPIIENQP